MVAFLFWQKKQNLTQANATGRPSYSLHPTDVWAWPGVASYTFLKQAFHASTFYSIVQFVPPQK